MTLELCSLMGMCQYTQTLSLDNLGKEKIITLSPFNIPSCILIPPSDTPVGKTIIKSCTL